MRFCLPSKFLMLLMILALGQQFSSKTLKHSPMLYNTFRYSFSLQLGHKLLLACINICATNILKKIENISKSYGAQPSENSFLHKSNKKTGKNLIIQNFFKLELIKGLKQSGEHVCPPTPNSRIVLRTVSFVNF